MKAFLVGVLSFLLSACTVLSPLEVSDKSSMRVLRQATYELTSKEGACSAVAIAPGVALSAAHCVGPEMLVGSYPAQVKKISTDADLMLLEVTGLTCPCIPVSGEAPELDEYVAVVGYPLGVGQIITEGRFQGPAPSEDARSAHMNVVTAPVIFGNSGGPVFALDSTHQFKVVGIVSALAVAQLGFFPNVIPHIAFVVKYEVIKEFVR